MMAASLFVSGLAEHGYRQKPIVTASGIVIPEYVDCRAALCDPDLLRRAVCGVLNCIKPEVGGWPSAIGALTKSAAPLAAACSYGSTYHPYQSLRLFYVGDLRVSHGANLTIVGPVKPGDAVCLVNDVITNSEKSILAIRACQEFGLSVRQFIGLVDCEQGGLTRIYRAVGSEVQVTALCTLSEVRKVWEAQRGKAT